MAGALVLVSLAAALAFAYNPPPSTFANLFPVENPGVRQALRWKPACNGVQCYLCPWRCFLPEGARGICKVRINHGGKLETMVYGRAVSAHIDPVEKKPVYHFLPGTLIYSIATAGCNLACKACQNWEISQIYPEQAEEKTLVPLGAVFFQTPDGRISGQLQNGERSFFPPEEVVAAALKTRCSSIAYTYSEPVIFYEYAMDTARLAHKKGLKNVMVTGGYINPGAMAALAKYMDVVKVDLKGFEPEFYKKYVGGDLDFIKRSLSVLKKTGAFVEVVNLVIPGLNDSPESVTALSRWVKETLGADTPLFFSRFSPNYKLLNLAPTPPETLTRSREIAMKEGLRYVYIGNLPGNPGENTYCPKCGRPLIKRYGYYIIENLISGNGGKCPYDGTKIPGVWN